MLLPEDAASSLLSGDAKVLRSDVDELLPPDGENGSDSHVPSEPSHSSFSLIRRLAWRRARMYLRELSPRDSSRAGEALPDVVGASPPGDDIAQ